eukprot:79261_1
MFLEYIKYAIMDNFCPTFFQSQKNEYPFHQYLVYKIFVVSPQKNSDSTHHDRYPPTFTKNMIMDTVSGYPPNGMHSDNSNMMKILIVCDFVNAIKWILDS